MAGDFSGRYFDDDGFSNIKSVLPNKCHMSNTKYAQK